MFLAIILLFFTSVWLGVYLCIERSNRRYFARRFNYCRKESALHLVTLMTSTYQLTYLICGDIHCIGQTFYCT